MFVCAVFVCFFCFFFNCCCGKTGMWNYLLLAAEVEGEARNSNYHESQCLLLVMQQSGPCE